MEANFHHTSGIRLVYCQGLVAVPWVYLKGDKMLGDERKQLPLLESNFHHASGIRLVYCQGLVAVPWVYLRGVRCWVMKGNSYHS